MAKLEPIYELPFVPVYDPVMPVVIDESERGVLCIYCMPSMGVRSVRVQADMYDIMSKLNVVTNNTHFLKFYRLGKYMVIMQTESKITWDKVFSYAGEEFDVSGCMLICKDNFTSLTQMEAANILGTARLQIRNNGYESIVHIDLEE